MPKSNKSNTTYDTYNNNNNNNSSSLLERSFRSNGSYIVRRKKIIYLLLFMILSIIIVLVPHQPAINKNNQQIGIDSRVYVDWLNPLLKSNNFQEFIQQASPILLQIQQAGDRPLSVIFLFAVAKLVNNPDLSYVIEHVPVILGPALVLATYFLTRELTSNDTTSLLAAFLTAISFHVLIGVYAGYYANWFSLIIGYLSIAFLIRFVKKSGNNNKINFIMFFVSLVLLQFAHIYTWGVLTLVLGIFLGVMLKLNYYVKKKVVLALLSIVSLIVIDFAAITLWTSGRTGLMERELTIVSQAGVGIQDFAKRWANLVYTTQIYFIGLFGNFIMLSLGSYWLYRSDLREQSTIFLIIFLSMGLLPLFFGDVLIKARVLYNIAFQIPAAIALTYLRQYRYGGNILVLSTCLWLFAISIRTISNFVGPL